MREIKYRAWDKRYNKMREVWMIDYRASRKYQMVQMPDMQMAALPAEWGNTQEHVVLMQFTGLKDKNGKEIYEGDIVKAIFNEADEDMPEQSTIHTVEWGIGHNYPAFDLDPINGDDEIISDEVNGFSYCIESGIDLEVIGNTYENPELLQA